MGGELRGVFRRVNNYEEIKVRYSRMVTVCEGSFGKKKFKY